MAREEHCWDAQRTATGQLTTRWQRVARRLGFGKRNREVAESAGTVPAKRRSTWAGKIAQHMRRAGALLRRKLPAYFSGLRTRIRNWWRGMPDVVRFQPEEPGDALVARLLAELRGIGGRPQDIKWEHGAFDDCVSSTFFPPDAPPRRWVPNLFLVMPKAETDLERLTTTSFEEGPTVSESELGRAARLQLSIGIIQTVANLHDQGLVHVDIKPGNFVVMSDGRLFLSDYGSCEKLGTAFDAWQVGLSLYVLWCKDRPEGIGRGVVLDFSKCPVDPPEAIKDLIRWFLQKDEGLRLLPLRAMRTRQFRQIKKEVERSLRHFAIQPPLETGEETQSVKLEQASLAEATERPGERGMTDTMSTGVEA
ncbi:rhoptry kinase family protein ROP24 (incomplete catalytic triad) [Besnoitia besnoiti]|uniref:Rhoptry kinase family protein ROP24 (Incomplete catalytic triad) n=1 Tax=Besnoitia besnoiti TaxID=94643 RepID=A0A2A9M6H9_BESBE|nr:rhoptry kinase family protein ROP24 (incomplete catalytic triad) [Besnoitia besnoiti]PFH31020.1 rhoptry kinase family protein ROP24 (incomplete catalytic triad) [Besnoitia besnoiti]